MPGVQRGYVFGIYNLHLVSSRVFSMHSLPKRSVSQTFCSSGQHTVLISSNSTRLRTRTTTKRDLHWKLLHRPVCGHNIPSVTVGNKVNRHVPRASFVSESRTRTSPDVDLMKFRSDQKKRRRLLCHDDTTRSYGRQTTGLGFSSTCLDRS